MTEKRYSVVQTLTWKTVWGDPMSQVTWTGSYSSLWVARIFAALNRLSPVPPGKTMSMAVYDLKYGVRV